MPDQEFEYLKVEITRTESTDLYLKVPKGWRPTWKDRDMIVRATVDTISESEWDHFNWQDTIEDQGHGVCTAEEAETYAVFDVVDALAKARPPETTAPSPPQSHQPADTGAPQPGL